MSKRRPRGFTLIELIIVSVIMGILAALAIQNFSRIRARTLMTQAVGDIKNIEVQLLTYRTRTDSLPTSLANLGRGRPVDPWGRPYQYLRFLGLKGNGQYRKDRFLVPLNSEYDLYSVGPDGATSGPLSAGASQDDIIRALDGAFVGVAADF